MKPAEKWKRTTIANRLMVWMTAAVAIATACLAVAAVFQYLTAREQSKAATEQARAAREQATLMQGQLKTMQEQANSMREQTNTLKDSLTETQKLVHQNERAVKATEIQANASKIQASASQVSAKAAKRSVEVATEGMHLQYRPIVGPETVGLTKDIKIGENVSAYINFMNQGISPAVQTVASIYIGFNRGYEAPPSFVLTDKPSVAVLAPNVPYHTTVSTSFVMDDAKMRDLTTKEYRLFVFGSILYEDLFGQSYETKFCFSTSTFVRAAIFDVCSRGNSFK